MTTTESKPEAAAETPKKEEDYKIELLPEDYPQYDLSFKLIFIGDSSVGKSCLTTKAVKNNFEEYYQATVGFEFLTFNMKVNDKVIKLQIWDTCGQEIYKSLISNFYRNSSLAVLVYAIDNKESFTHVENWLNDLKSQANDDVRIFLVGNKADLEEDRKVTKEEGEKYKLDQHLDLFMETSAKTGQNARNVLVEAAKILYNDYLKFNENGANINEMNNNNENGNGNNINNNEEEENEIIQKEKIKQKKIEELEKQKYSKLQEKYNNNNNNKAHFPFEKVVMPLTMLLLASYFLYFINF